MEEVYILTSRKGLHQSSASVVTQSGMNQSPGASCLGAAGAAPPAPARPAAGVTVAGEMGPGGGRERRGRGMGGGDSGARLVAGGHSGAAGGLQKDMYVCMYVCMYV